MTTPSRLNQHPDWDGVLWFSIVCGIIGFAVVLLVACYAVGEGLRLIAQAAQP